MKRTERGAKTMKRKHVFAGLIILELILLVVTLVSVGRGHPGFTYSSESSNENLLPELTNCSVQIGVPYAPDTNPFHRMNVYLPVGNGPFPAIIYIHGGGWSKGNCSEYDDLGQFYAKRGIAGFSIDYTLTDPVQNVTSHESSWPDDIQDVIRAIRYIKENANEFQIDPNKIALMGDSAGGHLASLAGVLSGNETFLGDNSGNPQISSRVCLVIDYYGPTDFQYIGEYGQSYRTYYIVGNFLGDTSFDMNQTLWLEASPATYITANQTLWIEASPTTYLTHDDPIFFIAHGTNDTVVPVDISESFAAKLEAAGIETHFCRIQDGDHDILTSEEENLKVRYSLEPLLKKVFNLQPQSNLWYTPPIVVSLALFATLLAAVVFKEKPKPEKDSGFVSNPLSTRVSAEISIIKKLNPRNGVGSSKRQKTLLHVEGI